MPSKYLIFALYLNLIYLSNAKIIRKMVSRSHYDIAHLHPLTNVPSKYQLPTPYGLWDKARTNFFQLPARSNTMGENNIPTVIKGCGVI